MTVVFSSEWRGCLRVCSASRRTHFAANYLQVPKATIYSWRYHGTAPPAVKLGRHLRWKPEDVEAWLVERTSTGSHSSDPL
ncbi:MAG: helix-turn-helix domain-containing protein [Actinobacteria bacterium]|nr:helix-turn-helix domain-containing protein [Actinomycetota bacterium]